MPLAKDIWRPLIVEAPITDIWRAGGIEGFTSRWLPEEGFLRFTADPFGIEREGLLHVFVERYDYRTRRGVIDTLPLDRSANILERREVLAAPWHLSYPYVFEHDGDVWMLPEAHRAGGLALYRATVFPWAWERACQIELDRPAVDATPLFHEGRWWLFYAGADDERHKTGALFAAWADRLTGGWHPHSANPIRQGASDCRPGGTPVLIDGVPVLPVQDCTRTYGGAIRPLAITCLTPDRFEAEAGPPLRLPPGFAPFNRGMHTLSAAGSRTLIDVKRQEVGARSLAVLAMRELKWG